MPLSSCSQTCLTDHFFDPGRCCGDCEDAFKSYASVFEAACGDVDGLTRNTISGRLRNVETLCSFPPPPVPPSPSPPPAPPLGSTCSPFQPNSSYVVCSNQGDPHVRGYDGRARVTCNATGWMDMHVNEHFSVSVWAEPSPKSGYSAVSHAGASWGLRPAGSWWQWPVHRALLILYQFRRTTQSLLYACLHILCVGTP